MKCPGEWMRGKPVILDYEVPEDCTARDCMLASEAVLARDWGDTIDHISAAAWHAEALSWEGTARDYGDRLRELGDGDWVAEHRADREREGLIGE